ALPEATLVRLHWTPVEATDLAGYDLYRAENSGPEVKLNEKPLTETTFLDSHIRSGATYRYRVRSVDRRGNASAFSPPAEARPFSGEWASRWRRPAKSPEDMRITTSPSRVSRSSSGSMSSIFGGACAALPRCASEATIFSRSISSSAGKRAEWKTGARTTQS